MHKKYVTKNTMVANIHSGRIGRIVKVNLQWGWFTIKYMDGSQAQYRVTNTGTQIFRLFTPEEYADYILELENSRTTDHWLDQ